MFAKELKLLAVGILGVLFIWSTLVQMSHSVYGPPHNLGLAPRLAVAGRYCDALPVRVQKAMLAYAEYKEQDSRAREIIADRPLDEAAIEHLSEVYRTMAQYRLNPTEDQLLVLRARAYQATERLLLSSMPILAVIAACGLILLFVPAADPPAEPADPTTQTISQEPTGLALGMYLLWWAIQQFALPYLLSALRIQNAELARLSALSLYYGSLLAILYAGFRMTGFPSHRPALRGAARGYLQVLLAVNALEWVIGYVNGVDLDRYTFDPGLFTGWSTPGCGVFLLIALILGPYAEELLFRGWLLERAVPKMGENVALAFISALFAIGHGNVWAVPGLFTFSWIVGKIYLQERSVTGVFLIHAAWNLTSLCLGYMAV